MKLFLWALTDQNGWNLEKKKREGNVMLEKQEETAL